MRTGIGVSYTIAAILVIGGLLLVLVQSHGAADYYAPLYLGAVFSISGVAAGSFGSLRDSLLDEFVELVEDCSAPAPERRRGSNLDQDRFFAQRSDAMEQCGLVET